MADEIFQDGVYGESLWINSTKNIFSLSSSSSSTNCASSLLDPIIGQYFAWPRNDQLFLDMKNRSNNNDDYVSSSDDSMVFQELPKNHNLSSMDYDSNLQILGVHGNSSSPPDWNQSLNDSILQENLNSSQNCPHHDGLKNFSNIISEDYSLIKPIMNQDFTNYYSDLLQTLFDSTNPHQDQQSFNYVSSSSTNKKRQNLNDLTPSKFDIEKIEESTYKQPRIETPSSLPTFKVRKEKLGDRITALQQLVSPFGKTDTASVLQEAIEYINFLHDQVLNVLRTSCLKNGSTTQHQQVKNQEGLLKQDLRSKGLCLVPISSTFSVAAETTMDFWTPTLGRTFT